VSTEREGWYAVSLSNGVPAGTSNGTYLFGEEIVVWRDAGGTPHVWVDRCPHRGMRLSYGFVRSDRIACLYHGWQYGTDGHCLKIPAHPVVKPPDSIVVWRHSCREAAGLIFAHFGEAADAPELPPGVGRETFTPVRSIHVETPAEVLVDRFAALTIAPFHPRLRAEDFAPTTTDWLVTRSVERDGVRETLLAAVQPIGSDRSALHLLVNGSGDYAGAGQKYFAKVIEGLRDGIEGGWLPATGAIPTLPGLAIG
jgi:nitrite reductase/ring-hydroxylating ferredoxin subunit